MGLPDDEELKYTMDKISDNFSNYSAWHNRSILLSNLLIQQSKGFESKQKIFSEEFELVTQALFTDPSDQSGWFYHLWLLAQTSSPDNPQLIASWPSNAAKLSFSFIKEKAEQHTLSSVWSRTVPIVLYFNEPVKGLNHSSVNLKSDLEFGKDIQWRPLTMADSGYSKCWATYLQITNECSSLQEYSVEMSIPCSDDIVSRSGSNYNCPVHFTFYIELISNNAAQGLDTFDKPVAWNCSDSFQSHGNRDPIPLDLLNITSALVEHDSDWHFERLSEEIDLFRELADDNRLCSKFVLNLLFHDYNPNAITYSLFQQVWEVDISPAIACLCCYKIPWKISN
ncbi:Geranylgeranyl transferase type-2 subunit alpha 1 [Zea mays]|nr:Geranylgeranyl transferase type-2 subunit alpha 1 [Zea mays]